MVSLLMILPVMILHLMLLRIMILLQMILRVRNGLTPNDFTSNDLTPNAFTNNDLTPNDFMRNYITPYDFTCKDLTANNCWEIYMSPLSSVDCLFEPTLGKKFLVIRNWSWLPLLWLLSTLRILLPGEEMSTAYDRSGVINIMVILTGNEFAGPISKPGLGCLRLTLRYCQWGRHEPIYLSFSQLLVNWADRLI